MRIDEIRKEIAHARLYVSPDWGVTFYCCTRSQLKRLLNCARDDGANFLIEVDTEPSKMGIWYCTATWLNELRAGRSPFLTPREKQSDCEVM